MKGHLHVHDEMSLNDSAIKVKDLVKKAKSMGVEALALTNHGNLLGIDQFMALADDSINLIPGVEVYVGKNKSHLVLLAANIDGYHDICNIVTESNHPDNILVVNKKMQYPITTLENLKRHASGNFFVLSACMGGIISDILLRNKIAERDIRKTLNLEEYKTHLDKKKELDNTYAALKVEIKKHKKDTSEHNLISQKIEVAQGLLSVEETYLKKHNKAYETCQELYKTIVPEENLYKEAVEMAATMKEYFGDKFYMEIQNHNIPEERYVMPILVKIAKALSIPLVATNDVHILDNSKESILARSVLQYNRFERWFGSSAGDAELYMKSDEEMVKALRLVMSEQDTEEAMNNITKIQKQCNVKFERTYHYPTYNCDNAKFELSKCAYEGLAKRYSPNRPDYNELIRRTEYELSVINKMGFADYLLIVKDFLEYGKKIGHLSYAAIATLKDKMNDMNLQEMIEFVDSNMTEPGEMIGPGRGSAAGSIVCYEIGITDIDPIQYGLMFERFLNPNRVSMPDIDSDFSLEVRAICIEYCRKKYSADAVCGINTIGTVAAKGSIRLVARALAAKQAFDHNIQKKDSKEAISKEYLNLASEICKKIPGGPNVTLSNAMEELEKEYTGDVLAMNIIKTALLVEGSAIQTGTHAAGIIISDKRVSDYLSLMYDTTNEVYKVQADMVEVEGIHGLLKMDFLGLRTLSIITMAVRLIKENKGVVINPQEIPVETEVIKKIFGKQLTNGVFQYESGFMKQNLKKLQPETLEDVILINAVGRPGPMQFIDPMAKVKAGTVKPDYLIPELEGILGQTYSYPVYQEQIIQLMQFAGMTAGDADNVRRHMSKKHFDEFMAYQPQFVQGMVEKGAEEEKTIAFWDALVEFSKYAFNKSHSAAYAVIAYQTAWLKYYYPAEFICAALEFCEKQTQIPGLISDAKALGVNVLPPDVNRSKASFSVFTDENGDNILFGICSLKGCGDALINEFDGTTQFASLAEFIFKKRLAKDVTVKMIQAGAFDQFNSSRRGMVNAATNYYTILDNIKSIEKKIKEKKNILDVLDAHENDFTADNWKDIFESAGIKLKVKNIPKRNLVENSIAKFEEQLKNAVEAFAQIKISNLSENRKVRLDEEREITGFYITGHPVESYEAPQNCPAIDSMTTGKDMSVFGLIKNVEIKNTRKDNRQCAFFEIEDTTGSVKCKMWPDTYEEKGMFIQEGTVVVLKGRVDEEEVFGSEGETEFTVTVNDVLDAKEKKEENNQYKIVRFKSYEESQEFWNDIFPKVQTSEETGKRLMILYGNQIYPTTVFVSDNIDVYDYE